MSVQNQECVLMVDVRIWTVLINVYVMRDTGNLLINKSATVCYIVVPTGRKSYWNLNFAILLSANLPNLNSVCHKFFVQWVIAGAANAYSKTV